GRMTSTGALMKVYEGAALVADKARAKVVPISIEGLQFSRFGRMGGKLRQRWFPRLRLHILPAVTLAPHDEDLTPRQRRDVSGRALQDAMVDAVFRSKETSKTLFAALLEACRAHGARRPIAEDIDRVPMNYGRLIVASAAIGRALTAITGDAYIGLMMPNALASVVSFMGLQAFGHVPCVLNVSAE